MRAALAQAAADRAEHAEATITALVDAYTDRVRGVVLARLRSPKTRKGTRYWSDRVKSAETRGVDVTGAPMSTVATSDEPRTEVAGIEVKALDPDYVLPDALIEESVNILRPGVEQVAHEAARDAADRIVGGTSHPGGMFAVDENLLGDLIDEALEDLLGAADRYASELRQAITDGESQDMALDDLVEHVGAAAEKGGNWLRLNGRTVATALAGKAQLESARALGVTHTQWLCVAADTQIWAPGALNVARRWSTEGLLRIRVAEGSSRRLAVTPDHPLLTQRGWVAARDLHVGDRLVGGPFGQRDAGSDPHVEHQPSEIAEVFAAAAKVRPSERVVRPLLDLDGDGGSGDVDVVALDREVRRELEATFHQPFAQQFLAVSDLAWPSLLAARDVAQGGVSLCATDVQRGQELAATLGDLRRLGRDAHLPGCPVVTPRHVVASHDVTQHVVVGMEPTAQLGGGDAVAVGGNDRGLVQLAALPAGSTRGADLVESFRPGGVPAGRFGRREQDVAASQAAPHRLGAHAVQGRRDLGGSLASAVTLHEVVDIEFDPAPCHVYDLQTATGWFVANGYVVHNSRRDDRVRPTHVVADGQVRPIGEKFRVGGFELAYPGDPTGLPASAGEVHNCFLAGTVVSAPDVEGSFRAPYVGEVVAVRTAAGRVVEGTVNHPVLTERGWVALGELRQGDNLVSARGVDPVHPGVDPHEDDAPAAIEEVHRALTVRAPVQRVSELAVNFHGDRPSGEVDVVTVDRPLRIGAHAALGQQVSDHDFPRRGEAGQVGASAGGRDHLVIGPNPAAAGDVRGGDQGVTASVVEVSPALNHGGGAPAWLYTAAAKAGPNGGPVDPERFAERLLALACPVAADDLVVVEGDAQRLRSAAAGASLDACVTEATPHDLPTGAGGGGDLIERLAGAVELDCVVQVERRAFSGHVYTLQASSGMFLANSIPTKNCRCGLLLASSDDDLFAALTEIAASALADLSDEPPPGVDPLFDAADAATASALAAEAAGRPYNTGPTDFPAPENVTGWRVLDSALDVVPGQHISLPAGTSLGLVAPADLTAETLAVLVPAGTAVRVAGGTLVLVAATEVQVLAAGGAGVQARIAP